MCTPCVSNVFAMDDKYIFQSIGSCLSKEKRQRLGYESIGQQNASSKSEQKSALDVLPKVERLLRLMW